MREIVFDTETTGLDPFSGHRIVEIGCVEIINKIPTGKVYHTYLNPQRDVPEPAYAVHGLDFAFLQDKPLFKHIAREFSDFVQDSPLVIHNAGFDMKFINYELKQVGLAEIPFSQAIDTLLIARKKFPGAPASLDALCRKFSVDSSAREKHGALLDAELLAEVYLELCGGRQSMIAFDVAKQQKDEQVKVSTIEFPKRSFSLPEEEAEAHRAFMKQIDDALWSKFKEHI